MGAGEFDWLLFWPSQQPSPPAGRWVRRQITGAHGLRLAATLLVLTIVSTVWLEKRAGQWVAQAFSDVPGSDATIAALAAATEAHRKQLSADVEVFAASVQVPFQLNDDFRFTEIMADAHNLFIRVDTGVLHEPAPADRACDLPVFCRFDEVPGFLARGAEVTVSIHGPDGAPAIRFIYGGSACDS